MNRYTDEQDARRMALCGVSRIGFGGVADFDDLTLATLDTLISEGFADPRDTQNSSPSIKQFRDYMAEHPNVTAHGYLVSNDRDDRRVSIEGLSLAYDATPEEQLDFMEWNHGADELDRFRSWWD